MRDSATDPEFYNLTREDLSFAILITQNGEASSFFDETYFNVSMIETDIEFDFQTNNAVIKETETQMVKCGERYPQINEEADKFRTVFQNSSYCPQNDHFIVGGSVMNGGRRTLNINIKK